MSEISLTFSTTVGIGPKYERDHPTICEHVTIFDMVMGSDFNELSLFLLICITNLISNRVLLFREIDLVASLIFCF